jgi:hypothetical protein
MMNALIEIVFSKIRRFLLHERPNFGKNLNFCLFVSFYAFSQQYFSHIGGNDEAVDAFSTINQEKNMYAIL